MVEEIQYMCINVSLILGHRYVCAEKMKEIQMYVVSLILGHGFDYV